MPQNPGFALQFVFSGFTGHYDPAVMDRDRERAEEDHLREVDRVLLYISEANVRAERAVRELREKGADERFVRALQTAAAAMNAEHKRLMNATFYSVPHKQERLDVGPEEFEQGQLILTQESR